MNCLLALHEAVKSFEMEAHIWLDCVIHVCHYGSVNGLWGEAVVALFDENSWHKTPLKQEQSELEAWKFWTYSKMWL